MAFPHVVRPVEDITAEELDNICGSASEKVYNRAIVSIFQLCEMSFFCYSMFMFQHQIDHTPSHWEIGCDFWEKYVWDLEVSLLFLPEFVQWPLPSQLACFHSGTTVVPKGYQPGDVITGHWRCSVKIVLVQTSKVAFCFRISTTSCQRVFLQCFPPLTKTPS